MPSRRPPPASFQRRLVRRIAQAPAAFGVACAFIAFLTFVSGAAFAQAEDAPSGVLILYSNQRATPAQAIVEDTLRTAVTDGFKGPIRLYSEYLDDEWAAIEAYGPRQAEFLRQKYEPRNIRVIVAVALPALRFAIQYGNQVAPGAAISHLAVAADRVDAKALPANVVGEFEDNDPTPTLELALRLHPGTDRIVLVRGASELDRRWDARMRAAAARLPSGTAVEFLSGLPTADVLVKVAALPRGTIVFTPGYFNDGAGHVSTPRQVVERIASSSSVPVYGAFDTMLGSGIVGGYMNRYEDQAREVGAIVVRLLEGNVPTQIATAPATRVPMVDWRQVKRWRIEERLLPADAVVRFHESTVWEKYWREISLGFVVLLLQAGMIAALLIERRSRQRMASALEDSQRRMGLAAKAARLSMFMWDVAGIEKPASGRVRRRARKPDEPLIAFETVLERTHPADRDRLEQAVRKAEATGDEFDVEYRVPVSPGAVRWVAARGRAEHDQPEQMLGVAVDITERKLTELRAVEDRNALRHMTRVSMLGQLSASIAHQLNQPLAAILGNAEAARKMLAREPVDLAELREICDDIVSDDNRAAEVIRRLGALYRARRHEDGAVRPERADSRDARSAACGIADPSSHPSHELAPALPVIDGGRVQLQQVCSISC
jgi:signal transduction histidine kinase